MLKWFLKKINNRKGFTLIELIVVIAILGILAAIAVPRFASQTEAAKTNACLATQRTIDGAAAMYIADGGTVNSSTNISDLVSEYLASEPVCPGGGTYSFNDDGVVECDKHAKPASY